MLKQKNKIFCKYLKILNVSHKYHPLCKIYGGTCNCKIKKDNTEG